ncbi:MAG: glycoside hydrolase, partial [Bacteroidota bacterium]
SIGYPPADYEKLLNWWRENSFGKHLYIGHALYKIDNNADRNWENPAQISQQIEMTRQAQEVQGSIFFSSKWFRQNPLGVTDTLEQSIYRYPALVPEMPWLDATPPAPPFDLEIDVAKEGLLLSWEIGKDNDDVAYYAIYRRKGKESPDTTPEYLTALHRDSLRTWIDTETRPLRKYAYTITALDRMHNESKPLAFRSKRRWSGLFRKK